MKTNKWIKVALFASFAALIFQACSKDDDQVMQETNKQNFNVRPDFATVDNRPAEVIANFQVTAKDATPVMLSKKATKGGKYAVVIGISDYDGTANDLEYCDDDANDWKARLQAEGYSVTSLTDRNATMSAIEAAVNNLASLSIAGNEIAFCYSGHGSRGNIISTDLYYISSSWFQTKFANSTSTKMYFSFDACQIGAMATSLNANGRVIAVASSKNTYSYDGDATMQNGVFTYYQMEGFDQVGYIYAEPDCQYAIDEMKAWAKLHHVRVAPSYVDSYVGDLDL
ncbi:MAG: caspase family protein [Bacteroidales bacterium]|nr:caspase family protein [Bacteroidales bacterium]HPD95077.1 caspase family protein [Tenuifilaceae bacterium]HRX30392.1 caspase family protein [Tenuifilaceae bacterium]